MILHNIPVTIVDNFFQDPDSIRNYALSLNYKDSNGQFPGKRSLKLDVINRQLENILGQKIFSLFFDLFKDKLKWDIESSFQIISEKYGEGWVHDDSSPDGWNIAGIIYLHPNPPANSGTSIYTKKKDVDYSNIDINRLNGLKHSFYQGRSVDIVQYEQERDSLTSKFTKSIDVENVYNRLLVYNASDLHKANKFFGTTDEDSRLTLVFYARFQSDSFPPVVRASRFIDEVNKLGG